VIVERRGTRIGFLAYCVPCHATATEERAGAAPLEIGVVREDLATLRPRVDCAIVSLHFGMMYLEYPTPEDMKLARSVVAAGADVVLGHHPHVLQGIEQTPQGLIAYSLGEFVFDPQAGNYYARVARDTRRRSMIFRAAIQGRTISLLEPIPTLAGDDLAPRVLQGAAATGALDSMKALSAALEDAAVRNRFWDYAGKEIFEYEVSGVWFDVRRGNVLRLLSRIPRIRLRHLKLALGYLRSRLAGASTTR
jgi:poly-gamma-glutamate synthesis protein (capsule biosynthesis protein)